MLGKIYALVRHLKKKMLTMDLVVLSSCAYSHTLLPASGMPYSHTLPPASGMPYRHTLLLAPTKDAAQRGRLPP